MSSMSAPGGSPCPVTVTGVPTGPCSGVTLSRPTNPPEGSPTVTTGPSSAASGAASAFARDASENAVSAQATALSRPRAARVIISSSTTGSLLRLDLDRPGLDFELGGGPIERLPGRRIALLVDRGDLVGQRARRIVGRDDPDRRPETVGGRAVRRMRAINRLHLLAIGHFDEHGL